MNKRVVAVAATIGVIAAVLAVFALANHGTPAKTAVVTPSASPRPTFDFSVPDSTIGNQVVIPYGTNLGFGQTVKLQQTPDSTYSGPELLLVSVDEYNPAGTRTSGPAPPSGEHYIATLVSVYNYASTQSSTPINVVGGAEAIDTNGKMYAAVSGVGLDASTPLFPAGEKTITGAQLITGWVVFAVPTDVSIAKIHVAPKGIYDGAQASWGVCDIAHPQVCR